ncbi:MAG TPA: ABC transporter substrate-binding protein [Chloroflexota bacterium]|nr:ABC transporter substrate-binding protein [Chloroflexota bacterium]
MTLGYIGVSGGVLPLWMADDGGIFAKNGLDVKPVTSSTSSAANISALMANQMQIVWTDGTSAVNARANGGELTVVATMHPAYGYLIMAAPDIKTPQDLKGKKMAVSSLTGTDAVASILALSKLGLDWQKDVTLVATGDNASRTAALIGGAVQATLQEPPGSLELEAKGFHSIADLTPMNLPSVNASIIFQTGYLNSHHDEVQKVVDSLVEANARIKKDRAYSIDLLKKYFKSNDDKTMGAVYDFYIPLTPTLPFPKTELFGPAIDQLAKQNPKVKDVDLNKVIDASFVQSAADRHLDQG